MDKIVARARSWASRALSYAGRLQLINSILFAIQTYWSSLFILPKSVIKQVEQVLRNFLWKGSDLSHGGAKVAWASICLTKQEGGLGITNFEVWNLAAMLKHIWHICSDGDQSIWSNWVRSYLIRHRDFWEMRRPGVCSWAWGKL